MIHGSAAVRHGRRTPQAARDRRQHRVRRREELFVQGRGPLAAGGRRRSRRRVLRWKGAPHRNAQVLHPARVLPGAGSEPEVCAAVSWDRRRALPLEEFAQDEWGDIHRHGEPRTFGQRRRRVSCACGDFVISRTSVENLSLPVARGVTTRRRRDVGGCIAFHREIASRTLRSSSDPASPGHIASYTAKQKHTAAVSASGASVGRCGLRFGDGLLHGRQVVHRDADRLDEIRPLSRRLARRRVPLDDVGELARHRAPRGRRLAPELRSDHAHVATVTSRNCAAARTDASVGAHPAAAGSTPPRPGETSTCPTRCCRKAANNLRKPEAEPHHLLEDRKPLPRCCPHALDHRRERAQRLREAGCTSATPHRASSSSRTHCTGVKVTG